ncbi:hypothetical protein PG994_003222 [Apiospora phragmitis]|uniref:Uncharacterized protein n=1 Tax=Apiospora phragmitis TaxID=2905665 RepID=A0ABR1W0K8_9PEZI
MAAICKHRKGKRANGTPRNFKLKKRTEFEKAKDAMIPVWDAVKLLNKATEFKRLMTTCLSPEAMGLKLSQIAAAAAAANTAIGGSGSDDAAVRNETREEEDTRLIIQPQMYEDMEKFIARVKTTPYGARLEDMSPESQERDIDHEANNDDDDDERVDPSALPSIEEGNTDDSDDSDSSISDSAEGRGQRHHYSSGKSIVV